MERNANRREIRECYRLAGSGTLSVLLHCVALAVLSCSSTIYPLVASPSPNQVLWFYPSLLFGSMAMPDEAPDPSLSPEKGGEVRSTPRLLSAKAEHFTAPAGRERAPVREGAGPAEATGAQRVEPASRELSLPAAGDAPPLIEDVIVIRPAGTAPRHKTVTLPSAADELERRPPHEPEREAGKPPVVANSSAGSTVGTDRQQIVKEFVQRTFTSAVGKPRGAAPLQPARGGGGRQVPSVAVRVLDTLHVASSPSAFFPSRETAVQEGGTHAAAKGEGKKRRAPELPVVGAVMGTGLPVQGTSAATSVRAVPSVSTEALQQTATAARPAETGAKEHKADGAQGKVRGLFSPPLTGDIKFEISSRDELQRGVKITVGFRDFPRSRRNRPLNRSDALRTRPQSSKVVMPADKSIHAIIDHAAEGVYYLQVELDRQPIADVSITVRLFEGSSRARTTTIRLGAISGRQTVVRLLMPEGVVWEDVTAFSGSLEDSGSITRFNSETGLEWKEYH